MHEVLGDDVAVVAVPAARASSSSKRVATHADARAVVLAHHGLVTWGETHEESYGLTLELVDRATAYLAAHGASRTRRPSLVTDGVASSPPAAAPRPSLARAGGRCSPPTRPARARRPCRRRGAIAAARSTPDHMLRIGGRTACCPATTTSRRSSIRPRGSPASSRPGLGCVAAAPNVRTARRVRAEIAAHTHASVAATLDAFGGASWLDEREVDDFENWPLELYKLTLAAAAAGARRPCRRS